MRAFGFFLLLSGCALVHERPTTDASRPDAAVERCVGRHEVAIQAPPARRAHNTIRFGRPHASSDGLRVLATAEVISDMSGGMGASDVLTYDFDGGSPHVFFSSDVPYELGTNPGLTTFLEAGQLVNGRVVAEVRRFANDRFELVRSDDADEVAPDAPIDVALPTPDPSFAQLEVARSGTRAVRFDDRRGVIVYAIEGNTVRQEQIITPTAGLVLIVPSPRVSPSGNFAAFHVTADVLLVNGLEDGDTRALSVGPVAAMAFLDDERLLVLGPDHRTMRIVEIVTGHVTPFDLGLGDDGASPLEDAIDVSDDFTTFVRLEHDGAQLRVVHCDPRLMSLRP